VIQALTAALAQKWSEAIRTRPRMIRTASVMIVAYSAS